LARTRSTVAATFAGESIRTLAILAPVAGLRTSICSPSLPLEPAPFIASLVFCAVPLSTRPLPSQIWLVSQE
jgi:hypothetical protein